MSSAYQVRSVVAPVLATSARALCISSVLRPLSPSQYELALPVRDRKNEHIQYADNEGSERYPTTVNVDPSKVNLCPCTLIKLSEAFEGEADTIWQCQNSASAMLTRPDDRYFIPAVYSSGRWSAGDDRMAFYTKT